MLIWILFIIPLVCILIRLILYLIVKRYGKFSYDGFSAAGFAYNPEKDIFYSTKNAWQKNFGYTHMYDVLAPIGRMIVDTEPIRFYYNNKNWLITFWKGQYGIVTGAEVGIYCTEQKKINKKTVYFPANDSEMLIMEITLYKKNKMISSICCKHWWLAIFKLGMFSKPKDLTMDVNITFPTKEMLDAFLKAFKKKGYSSKDYKVCDKTFCFRFKKPRTRKVWTRSFITDGIRQFFNRKNVELYNKYLSGLIDDNKLDDTKRASKDNVIILNELIPDLFKNGKEDKIEDIEIMLKERKNVVFLNSIVNPGTNVNYYEEIR